MRNKMNLKYIAGVLLALAVFTVSCKEDDAEPTRSSVTDIDGNVYDTVVIGTQVWMVQNLKVTKYRNGDAIPKISDYTEWFNSRTTGVYGNYGGDESNGNIYGRLYNFAAATDSRNIAPLGWHVPSIDEWQTLVDYLGGVPVAIGKMKETGTSHWVESNPTDDNSSGFTALPGGYRWSFGYDAALGADGYWWTSTTFRSSEPLLHGSFHISWQFYDFNGVSGYNEDENLGMSIRCIKDN